MARRIVRQVDRRSGWPPERFDRNRLRFLAADDAVLTILWIIVVVGLLLLLLVAATGRFAWSIPLVGTAEAAQSATTPDSQTPDPPKEVQSVSQLLPDTLAQSTAQSGVVLASFSNVTRADVPRAETSIAGYPVADVSDSSGVTLGRVIESTIASDTLGAELPYRVYLPPGYYSSTDRYPVLYLLHGNGLSLQTEWTEDLRIGVVADALISGGLIKPMIIAMPDGEHSYFMNQYGTGERWQDYIVNDVIPFIENHFRTQPDRDHRSIGGHSMGGSAALAIAFTYPDLFGSVAAHSPSLRVSGEGGPDFFGPPKYFAKYNPLDIAKVAEGIESLKIWVDFGTNDYWLEDGSHLLPILENRGIEPEWHISPGDHWASYWISNEPDYLMFHSEHFGEMTEPQPPDSESPQTGQDIALTP